MCVMLVVGIGASPLLAGYALCNAPHVGARAPGAPAAEEQGITVGRPQAQRQPSEYAGGAEWAPNQEAVQVAAAERRAAGAPTLEELQADVKRIQAQVMEFAMVGQAPPLELVAVSTRTIRNTSRLPGSNSEVRSHCVIRRCRQPKQRSGRPRQSETSQSETSQSETSQSETSQSETSLGRPVLYV